MKFGEKMASWKEIYECILSPLPNKYQTYIGHKQRQRKQEESEAEKKQKISGLAKEVQQELEKKGKGTKYTAKSIIALIMISYRMKKDLSFKEKLLNFENLRKSIEIRNFIKDTKDVLEKVIQQIHEILNDEDKIQYQKPKRRLAIVKDEKIASAKKESLSFAFTNCTEQLEDVFDLVDLRRHCRGKSCCCRDCGGTAYYDRFQKKINLFPLAKKAENKKYTK